MKTKNLNRKFANNIYKTERCPRNKFNTIDFVNEPGWTESLLVTRKTEKNSGNSLE